MARDGGARTASNGPGTESTVPDTTDIERAERMATYRSAQRRTATRSLDAFIAYAYGAEHVRRSA